MLIQSQPESATDLALEIQEGYTVPSMKTPLSPDTHGTRIAKGTMTLVETSGTPILPADTSSNGFTLMESGEKGATLEEKSRALCPIEGHKALWKRGISGTALQFDGYTSSVSGPGVLTRSIEDAIYCQFLL